MGLPSKASLIFLPVKGIQRSLNTLVAQNPSVTIVATQILYFPKNGCCRTEPGPGRGLPVALSVCLKLPGKTDVFSLL